MHQLIEAEKGLIIDELAIGIFHHESSSWLVEFSADALCLVLVLVLVLDSVHVFGSGVMFSWLRLRGNSS
jgi:hypothetical protein